MRTRIFCIISVFFIFLGWTASPASAADESIYRFTDQQKADRFQALSKEIRCLVCQNQSISDSNAPLAQDLRQKVYGLINENQSDAEIKDYLVKRYGEFILLNPRFNKLSVLLWLFPAVCLLLALSTFAYFVKRQ